MIDQLGPKLYDPNTLATELETRVRQALQPILDADRRRCRRPTAHACRRRSRTRSSATDRSSRCCGTRRSPRSWGTAPAASTSSETGRIHAVPASFVSDAHLRRTIDKIVGRVGRRVDEASPMVDARLPDGSRINAVIAPIALDGSMLTIHKFAPTPPPPGTCSRSVPSRPRPVTFSRPASGDAATSSSRVEPARARRRPSTSSPATSRPTSASSPSRTRPSSSSDQPARPAARSTPVQHRGPWRDQHP